MFMNALLLLLTLTSTIVLRSGDRITVEGAVREEKGVIVFRSNGVVYSMPVSEVERIDKQEAPSERDQKVRKLAVSEEERRRLLAELEKNHSGVRQEPLPLPKEVPPPPSRDEAAQTRREENEWRRQAREHEEAIRRAMEELQMLESRAADLQQQIHGFVSLGYRPRQFTYQTTQLARTERAYTQFKEDARRQGVMPGWLR
jgi:hypothetical protein